MGTNEIFVDLVERQEEGGWSCDDKGRRGEGTNSSAIGRHVQLSETQGALAGVLLFELTWYSKVWPVPKERRGQICEPPWW